MPELTLVEAVNLALARAMEDEADVVVLGEDVGVNGGVFRATAGLQRSQHHFLDPQRRHRVGVFGQFDRGYVRCRVHRAQYGSL